MYVLCIMFGLILLTGCTAMGNENVHSPNASNSTRVVLHNTANHLNANKSAQQKEYDAAIENFWKLPEYAY